MTSPTRGGRRTSSTLQALLTTGLAVTLVVACGDDTGSPTASGSAGDTGARTLVIGGIPDQDPDRLQRQFGLVADRLSELLDADVVYEPVAEYDAAVSAFRIGDLDLVWFGGLTGVQARLQVEGAQAIVQRDIDPEFRSVFLAGSATGIAPFDTVDGLTALEGRTFTFGSDSSTSGRLLPQAFLAEAGVEPADFDGEVGFSGSHDATIELVAAGSYETGVVNEQVWDARIEEGTVDPSQVVELFRTPTYFDYHWVVRPDVADRFGDDFVDQITEALTSLDIEDPLDAEILELFGAERFIPTENGNYDAIEEVARDIGRIEG